MEDQPLKIAHLITRFLQAGAEENTTLSCNSFAARGHRVALIHGRDHAEAMLRKLDSRVEVVRVPSLLRAINPRRDVQALAALRRVLRRLDPDIVHTHTSKAGILGRAAALGMPRAAVVHGIHILPFVNVGALERALYLGLERALAPFTQKFVSVSPGMRDLALANGVGRPAQHELVLSGMNLASFRTPHVAAGSAAALTNLRRQVVYLANYEPRKQHAALIEAVASQKTRFADATFLLAGQGAAQAPLEALVARHGLGDIVKILGFIDDPGSVIAAADVCIYCSSREGLPRAVIQYCAAGRPIVAFNLPGLEAVVREGVNGRICAQGNFEELLQAVRELLDDPAALGRMAAASAAQPLDGWSADHMYASLNRVYRDAIRERRPG